MLPGASLLSIRIVEDVARKLGNAYCPATAEEDEPKAAPADGEGVQQRNVAGGGSGHGAAAPVCKTAGVEGLGWIWG